MTRLQTVGLIDKTKTYQTTRPLKQTTRLLHGVFTSACKPIVYFLLAGLLCVQTVLMFAATPSPPILRSLLSPWIYPQPSVSGESTPDPPSTVTLTPRGFVGVWECASFSRTSWSESSNKLQGQQKNTRCPRSLKKTEAAQRKRWRAALLKPSKIRTFTSLCWKHLIKTCLLYFNNHTLISVTAVRAAQMCWVQRFSAKSGLS